MNTTIDAETQDAMDRAAAAAYAESIAYGEPEIVAKIRARHAANQERTTIANRAFDSAFRKAMSK